MTGVLIPLRRAASPIAALTFFVFGVTTLAPATAWANGPSEPPAPAEPVQSQAEPSTSTLDPNLTLPDESDEPEAPSSSGPATTNGDPGTAAVSPNAGTVPDTPSRDVDVSPLALPTGADKSGVTSKTISAPKGSGTIQGMGESFSAQLSTGIATFSVPFSLPAARGGAQPSLGLSYSSGGGFGLAGVGWSVGVPFIARQIDRGVPGYDDKAGWHPEQDRFVFNGGQELVPICVVQSGTCTGAHATEQMPAWAEGYQYFRPRVEGSFLRFFWKADHLTWRVQDKSGVTMELGVPLDGTNYFEAIENNPDKPNEIFRWHLVRQYDTWGDPNPASGNPAPVNLVVYRYFQDGGSAYLSDIFDTPPAANAATAPLGEYAHHTRVVYETRSDPTHSYRSGWRMDQRLRLKRLDVASKTVTDGVAGARKMVRRYHLKYDATSHGSLLRSVQVEGRCSGDEDDSAVPSEGSNGQIAESTNCARLPAMTFEYARVTPYTTSGSPGVADLAGYEGFDERIQKITTSPPHSVDEQDTDLFDIDNDGLPDVLVTAVGMYGSGHGVFFNSPSGVADKFGAATPMSVAGVLGAGANTITLKNLNVAPLDLDGDASIDLLHMPKVKTYAIYSLGQTAGGAPTWQGRAVTTANGQSPKIDWGKDTLDTQVMDVDFDGLVDVVVSTGTEMQTFFSLGRYPGGDGQFGSAKWTGPSTAQISNEPVTSCVPWSSTPIRFSDPDIKLADMNGDGINDIVRVRKNDIRYWPGRGNGFWGTGKRDDCPGGTFGSNRHVTMTTSPNYSDVSGDSLRLDDVNGDGLTDLVQVRFTDVDIWLNVDGIGWTDRHVIKNTPASPSYANRVRLVDVNGSGTRDILWGDGGDYRYIDLQGGERPWLLTRVDNGLGKTTDLKYSTSTNEMREAAQGGAPWTKRMPTVAHVVKRVVESDNLTALGDGPANHVTEYTYRDPVFEGRQREFRGFSTAQARRIGDANSPTDITESTFLLGECADENAGDGIDWCSLPERWRDNPREALKGLPVVMEKVDENGVYLSTDHTRYRLRLLYTGLDGREVRHAFETGKDSYLYDTANFVGVSSTTNLTAVELELEEDDVNAVMTTALKLRMTTGRAHLRSSSVVDFFGNQTQAIAEGCVDGCPESPNEEVITTHTVPILVTSQDGTGWLWRTQTSYVNGDAYDDDFFAELKRTDQTYLPQGVPDRIVQTLNGTGELDRFHESSATVASDPADASQDGQIFSQNHYDDFGNLEREQGPNNRCRDLGYDDDYAQLPTEEIVYTGGCESGGLTTGAAYDRGLALVALVTDMQWQPTTATYDSFGRLVELRKPHPSTPDQSSADASVKIEYFLPTDLGSTPSSPIRYSLIHTSTRDEHGTDDHMQSWSFVDGMGRTRVSLSEADTNAGDGGGWIAGGLVRYDAKGAVSAKHLECFWGAAGADAKTFPLSSAPAVICGTSPFGTQVYDAFGRQIRTTDLDGTTTLVTEYHALGSDLWDAADLEQDGDHEDTPASERKDGHGRTVSTIERFDESSTLKERETFTTYTPTGEPHTITRTLVGTANEVVRWMRYDSLGRMVLNVEPNTTVGFDDDPTTDPDPDTGPLKAWRYAYNNAGDLVGTSDARGCGVNFAYDGAGRLLHEDYSPCLDAHADYTAPNTGARTGMEVAYHYDSMPSDAPTDFQDPYHDDFLIGRLVGVYDRASFTVSSFDGRGRVVKTGVKLAEPFSPGDVDTGLDDRYGETRWYIREFTFDIADRVVSATTGATVADLLGTGSASNVTTTYSGRGTVASVSGSYELLIDSIERDADGLIEEIVYGDIEADTTTGFTYDQRRRLSSVTTFRNEPGIWTSPPGNYLPAPPTGPLPSLQTLLQADSYVYDVVGNPITIYDSRDEEEWPSDAKPVQRDVQYDDLYRLKQIDYTYDNGDDWTSPFDAENNANSDPRRANPSPHIDFDDRVGTQTYTYDWLGNTATSDDDDNGFYDRSLGTITNSSNKPYQLESASNETTPGSPINREGNLATGYDDAGNLTRMHLRRAGTCLGGANCNQIFSYDWDEVGRLVQARRWDVTAGNLGDPSDPLPGGTPDVNLQYAYDAGDQRVIKTAIEDGGDERYTLYIFETLELRRSEWVEVDPGPPQVFDYELTKWTEVPYLFANGVRVGRVVYEEDSPEIGGEETHVFLELGDHLGSTSVVIDKATSELVERSTTYAYGATESDYRPERWNFFREDYRFTGKEEDVEVGLQYFGKRFYAPMLQRWVSADPLGIHSPGAADLNVYAYVSGRALKAVDPLGLEEYIPPEGGPGVDSTTIAPVEGLGSFSVKAGDVTLLEEVTIEGDVPGPEVSRSVGFGGPLGGLATGAANAGVGAAAFFAGVGDMASGEAPIHHDTDNPLSPLLGAAAVNFEEWKFTPMDLDDPLSQWSYSFSSRSSAVAPAFGRGNTGVLLAEGEGAGRAGGGLASGYSVAVEVTLPRTTVPTGTRHGHRMAANQAVLDQPELAALLKTELGITIPTKASGAAGSGTPAGWRWHHAESPGTLQLVPAGQHTRGSPEYGLMHDQLGRGGFFHWGAEF